MYGSGSLSFISFICFSLKEHLVLVHYWGDHSLGKPADSTSHHVQTKLKIRTMPSVIREAKKAVINKPAHLVYEGKVIDPGEGHIAVAAPKNLTQIQNSRERVKNDGRLTKDAIINIYGIALDDPGFVHLIITLPDLLIVFGQQDLITYANEIMPRKDPKFYFTYDTTFTLGDFSSSLSRLSKLSILVLLVICLHIFNLVSTKLNTVSVRIWPLHLRSLVPKNKQAIVPFLWLGLIFGMCCRAVSVLSIIWTGSKTNLNLIFFLDSSKISSFFLILPSALSTL